MHTKRATPSTDSLARFNAALRRPHTWRITGIDAFWLEDSSGRVRTAEFADTGPAYDAVMVEITKGTDPEDIVLVGRNPRGQRRILGRGLDLQDIAEAHVGLPARRRIPSE